MLTSQITGIQDQVFTIFDTETTGLHPRNGDKIIEIAAIKMKGCEILEGETFESFVNPERNLSAEAQRVNKITEDMVADAPTIATVLPQFLDFAAGTILVAHNAEFDMGFLEEALFQTNPFGQLPLSICTKKLSRRVNPSEKFHNLDTLAYRFDITLPEEGRHRALTDVYLLAEVFVKLIDTGNLQTVEELKQMGN